MSTWNDPNELVTLTLRVRRVTRARVKGTAAALHMTPSELLEPYLFNEFSAAAPLQEKWIEGWKKQQEIIELEQMVREREP